MHVIELTMLMEVTPENESHGNDNGDDSDGEHYQDVAHDRGNEDGDDGCAVDDDI